MDAALVADGLTRRFGGVVALQDVHLAVPAGERHGIIGPNGAGKTTLFKVLSGELRPSSGRVLLDGRPVTGWPPHRIARAGMARTFQRNNLLPGLTALENVRLAVQAHSRATATWLAPADRFGDLREAASGLLTRVGLRGDAGRQAGSLSHGAQRQLEIGMALAGDPRILLLDEPTAGMSPAETAAVAALLAGLPRRHTLIVIEHDLDVVFGLADRITVLHLGRVLAQGPPDAVRGDARVQDVYLGRPGGPGGATLERSR